MGLMVLGDNGLHFVLHMGYMKAGDNRSNLQVGKRRWGMLEETERNAGLGMILIQGIGLTLCSDVPFESSGTEDYM